MSETDGMSDIIIPNRSEYSKPSNQTRSHILTLSRDAGRIVKQSSIPDILCWITVKLLELFRILEDTFSIYDRTLYILQYLSQTLLFLSTVGIAATVEFLRAYHETHRDPSAFIPENQIMLNIPHTLGDSLDLNDCVSLSVGGRVFTTRKSFLIKYKDSLFTKALMKSREIVFIDRDSYYFEHILNYMRGNLSYLQVTDSNSLRILLGDAEYYKLEDMISDLKVAIQHRYSFVNYQFIQDHTSFYSHFSFRQDQIITISIRGLRFQTRKSTIMAYKGSVLADIFSGDSVSDVFIDRDSTHFRHILNFYRGVNSTIDISDHGQLKVLLKEVRFYRLDKMEKSIKNQMDILSKKLEQEEEQLNNHNTQNLKTVVRGFLYNFLPNSVHTTLPYCLQSIYIKNCPVMITVGNELFCANASSLLAYDRFARMLEDTMDYTSEGYPKLWINRKSTYFHYILNYIDGENITQNIPDIGTLNGILEEANFFKLTELCFKLTKQSHEMGSSTFNWQEILLIGLVACMA